MATSAKFHLAFHSLQVSVTAAAKSIVVFTVRDGPSELQQTAKRQRRDVRLPPAVRLLLDVLLKLDPASRLLPLHLLVLVDGQLVQLHKHLEAASPEQRFRTETM